MIRKLRSYLAVMATPTTHEKTLLVSPEAQTKKRISNSLKKMAGLAVVIGWAVGFCYVCGMRGFFALDQSIIFDGAWRILQGQTPYLDFVLPFGPMVFWIQAATFALFGVTYQIYVLTAAALNGIGVILAYTLIRQLIPERRWLALVAGFLTGTWLCAPMGTPHPEQTGFIAVLASFTAVMAGLKSSSDQRRWIWMAVAGTSLGTAVLCKTNAGIFGVLAVLTVVATIFPRTHQTLLGDWLAIGMGTGVVFAGFALWLWTNSDPAMFRYSVFQLPSEQGYGRLFAQDARHSWLSELIISKGNDLVRIVILTTTTLLTLGLAAALNGCVKENVKAGRMRMLGVLALALVGYQNLFSLSSNNNGMNEVPFVGLILAFVVEVFLIVKESGKEPNGWDGIGRNWIIGILIFALVITALIWPKTKNLNLVIGVVAGLLIAWFSGWWQKADSGMTSGPGHARSWVMGVFWLTLMALGGLGITESYQRLVQDIFNSKTGYVKYETIPALQACIGQKEESGDAHANWSDFASVFQEFQNIKGQIDIVGDYTIFYGVVGRPSLGSLLWFHKGLTYPLKYDANQDQKLAQSVDRPDVTQIVVEQKMFMGTRQLVDFPLLQRVISDNYHPTKQFGLFKRYRRNESGMDIPEDSDGV